ncbi:hypothetical protein D3C78_1287050 [compost metagenome]
MWLLVEASISLDEVIHDLVWRPSSVVRFDMASSFAPRTVHADRGNMFAYAMCNAGERSFVISWCCSNWMERVAGEKRESEKLAWSLKRGGRCSFVHRSEQLHLWGAIGWCMSNS